MARRICGRNHLKMKNMEQLNRIELKGTIGSVRPITVNGETQGVHIRMVTSFFYTNSLREPVMEDTWHDVTIWQRDNFPDLGLIQKGGRIHVTGRVVQNKYISSDGVERTGTDINAYKVELIEEGVTIQTSLA